YGVAFHPDSRRLASASFDGRVRVWDARTGEVIRELSGHGGRVNSVAFSPDGQRLVTAGSDGTVRLGDVEAGLPLHNFKNHPSPAIPTRVQSWAWPFARTGAWSGLPRTEVSRFGTAGPAGT